MLAACNNVDRTRWCFGHFESGRDLLLWEADKGGCRHIGELSVATFAVSATAEGVDLFFHGHYDGVLSAANDLLDAEMAKETNLLGLVEEVSVAVAALPSVMLGALAAAPSEK